MEFKQIIKDFFAKEYDEITIYKDLVVLTKANNDSKEYVLINYTKNRQKYIFYKSFTGIISYNSIMNKYNNLPGVEYGKGYSGILRKKSTVCNELVFDISNEYELNKFLSIYKNLIHVELTNFFEKYNYPNEVVNIIGFKDLKENYKFISTPTEVKYLLLVEDLIPEEFGIEYLKVKQRLDDLHLKVPHSEDIIKRIELIKEINNQFKK